MTIDMRDMPTYVIGIKSAPAACGGVPGSLERSAPMAGERIARLTYLSPLDDSEQCPGVFSPTVNDER